MPTLRTLVMKLLGLGWPVALARLGIMAMGVVDAIVIGQVAPDQLPPHALGWAPTAILLVSALGLLTGVQVLAARAIGAGTPEHAGTVLRRGLMLALVAGCVSAALMWLAGAHVFTLAGIAPELAEASARVMRVFAFSMPLYLMYCAGAAFLEAVQKPLPVTYLMWAANLVNLALNLWLVPRYGAVGSAWATGGARTCLALALAVYIFNMPDATYYGVRKSRGGPGYRALLAVGAAAALSQAAEAAAFSGMTLIAGRIGGRAVAAYQLSLNLLSVVFMISLGSATATAVLAAEAVGREQPHVARRVSFVGLALNSLLMLACGAVMLSLRGAIGRAYTADAALAHTLALMMPWVAAGMLPDGAQTVVASALRAQGDNWFPTASHLLAYAAVMPVLGLWWGERQGLGVAGLLSAMVAASALSAGVLALRLAWLEKKSRVVSKSERGERRLDEPGR